MKCRICKNRLVMKRTLGQHVREQSLLGGDICTGCYVASVDIQTFLIRAKDRTVMGNWSEGWLKAIINDPAKYR